MLRAFLLDKTMHTEAELKHGTCDYHICDHGKRPRINPIRYRQLMEGIDKLAVYEIQQGWHFCPSHHGMLVVSQSTSLCSCPTPDEIRAMVEEAEAEDRKRYEMGIVAKLAPAAAEQMRESYYIKHDDGSITGVSYINQVQNDTQG